jgi:hypothetical protein
MMIRFAVSFAMVAFVVASVYAQPQTPSDKTAIVGCWADITTRKCQEMAFHGVPQDYWINCEVAICGPNALGLLECNYPTGLKVTDPDRTYKDVYQVGTGVSGKRTSKLLSRTSNVARKLSAIVA